MITTTDNHHNEIKRLDSTTFDHSPCAIIHYFLQALFTLVQNVLQHRHAGPRNVPGHGGVSSIPTAGRGLNFQGLANVLSALWLWLSLQSLLQRYACLMDQFFSSPFGEQFIILLPFFVFDVVPSFFVADGPCIDNVSDPGYVKPYFRRSMY